MKPMPRQFDKLIKELATSNGCKPVWSDGIFGWFFHCTCEDGTHYMDQQCSVISRLSAENKRPLR